jgi:hypothetical protein
VRGDRRGRFWWRRPRRLAIFRPRHPLLTGAGHDPAPGHTGGSPRLRHQDGHTTVPSAGARFPLATGPGGGDVRGHRSNVSCGRPRVSGHRVAVASLPAALGRGDAAAPRRARARSTGR